MNMKEQDLIYDWNTVSDFFKPSKRIEFDDETLRDGLQSPSVKDPTIEEKIEILHLMDDLGIDTADIALPGAGPRAKEQALRLAREIVDSKLNIQANCAARTVKQDILPVIEISQETGLPIEVSTFIGSSPIRIYAEEWNLDTMLRLTEESVTMVVEAGLPVMYVTEDTTRAHPDTVEKLYTTAIECGARRICVCDTVGHVIPQGVKNLIGFISKVVEKTGEDVKIDWHGHRDRGLSVPNTIAAIEAGVDRVHATALGIGERVGNTPMDILLVNLTLLGWIDRDLTKLPEYCQRVSEACEVPITLNYPVMGEDAFRTATGVHAAAVIKAQRKGDKWLADRVYSGVPAHLFGREQRIEIGPMSGESNIVFWLKQKGIEPKKEIVEKIFSVAKSSRELLGEEELLELLKQEKVI
ncbi:MAG: LeuA family protein [Candidatus Glassbacteria bacterium]